MNCPLCGHQFSKPSWVGSTYYQGKEFTYVECLFCSSLYCDPMPDGGTLSQMYGVDYQSSFVAEASDDGSRDGRRVIDLLKKMGRGIFVDYGCGAGSILTEAANLNWRAVGVEFDEGVAAEVEKKTGLEVLNYRQAGALNKLRADVLHLGDVIEHLTEMDRQMPKIINLIRPGGLLVAQGPLEANLNLFTLMIRLARSLRRRRRTEMAPYHVLLATARGQRLLFRRLGLIEMEYVIREAAWPAPSRLSLSDFRRPRSLGLYLLRLASKVISGLGFARMGNRYFYVGQKPMRVAPGARGSSEDAE
jgi:2-polyprenyl-3-methyl-5-hydroxy-6-metoxy-1,4-benzoquinol methylase